MKKYLVIIVFACIGIVAGVWFTKSSAQEPVIQSSQIKSVDSKEIISEKAVGLPTFISIPKINSNAEIESVGLDSERRMDVPKNDFNAGWYNLGPKPGEIGKAVIDGHLDTPSGEPSIFYDLDKLTKGDTILITDENNTVYTFEVIRVAVFKTADVPLEEIFASGDNAFLNLITCGGEFNTETDDYSERTVVYSQLVKE